MVKNPSTAIYTDGNVRKRFKIGSEPEGWTKAKKLKRKPKHHYTNGVDYMLLDADAIPPVGWYIGIPEARKKQIATTERGKPKSEHHNQALKDFWKNAEPRHWYTDGIHDVRCIESDAPAGWFPGQSDTRKARNSQSNTGKKMSPESAIKRVATRRANNSYEKSAESRQKLRQANLGKKMQPEVIEKIIKTKKANNTFSTSIPEQYIKNYYELLCDAKAEYRDDVRYPYSCDLYIEQFDLFIEINGHWTHGTHPFDVNDPADQNRLDIIRSKQKIQALADGRQKRNSYYAAEAVWTERDVAKINAAKANKLNYLTLYNVNRTNMIAATCIDLKTVRGITIIDLDKYYQLIKDQIKDGII